MTSALFRVNVALAEPLIARPGQYLAWYEHAGVIVLEQHGNAWSAIDRVATDATAAVYALQARGALTMLAVCGVRTPRPENSFLSGIDVLWRNIYCCEVVARTI